jgi:DNA-binding NtrC family response regulator
MMSVIRDINEGLKFSWLSPSLFHSLRIRTKLLITLIPATIIIIIATGYATNWFSSQFLNESIQRTVRLQTLALAHELEVALNQCKEELLELSQRPLSEASLLEFWRTHKRIRGWEYAEVAYFSKDTDNSVFLVSREETVVSIPAPDISLIRPDPRNLAEKLESLRKDEVYISSVAEGVYPVTTGERYNRNMVKRVIRFVTFSYSPDGKPQGMLVLGISVYRLRDILCLFSSPQSPIFAYIRSPELRYSYLFDTDGWIWFQSEEVQGKSRELSTQMARTGFSGTFGKPALKNAFKPFLEHTDYWQMVSDIQQGKHGLIVMRDETQKNPSMTETFYVGYAPVRFTSSFDGTSSVFAGVAFADRSRLGLWAGYRQIDVIFVLTLATTLLSAIIIYTLSRVIAHPIFDLAAAVNEIQCTGELKEIRLPDHDYETGFLKYSINNLLGTIQNQLEEIKEKDKRLREATQRERAKLEDEIRTLKQNFLFQNIQDIVGLGPSIESLKTEILKAASVEADVLIIGETGTGKQLTAEAIHKNSPRAEKPFISVNCGALDENLLLDELFGHVKGAFTEARTDRKGAFLAADGGTLFMDEIGTASPKVQQSLLRAIAMRKISPLGSDHECNVDVKLIAATNEDLKDMVEKGRFREDLYYRLNVITIRTPALRDHREDIPVLADHFLKEAGRRMSKEYIGLTQGALEKMKDYHWPGNVRELKNCITRAVAMAEGSLIHEKDILLEGVPGSPESIPEPVDLIVEEATSREIVENFHEENLESLTAGISLNERQKRVLRVLVKNGEISRSEYQKIIGNGLPSRTALYDLQDMVKKGVLKMTGRGPAVRYRLIHK